MKILVKGLCFVVFPLIYTLVSKDRFFRDSVQAFLKQDHKIKSMKVSLILGTLILVLIVLVYGFIDHMVDQGGMIEEFESKYRISKSNILFYGLYLIFINSFLEEFFFRGFIFLSMKKEGKRLLAYVYSSLLFAVYHIANIQNWMALPIFILAMSGLFVGGLIFNYLDDKANTFINSWFVHICADISIVYIGLKIFGVM